MGKAAPNSAAVNIKKLNDKILASLNDKSKVLIVEDYEGNVVNANTIDVLHQIKKGKGKGKGKGVNFYFACGKKGHRTAQSAVPCLKGKGKGKGPQGGNAKGKNGKGKGKNNAGGNKGNVNAKVAFGIKQ